LTDFFDIVAIMAQEEEDVVSRNLQAVCETSQRLQGLVF